MAGPGAEADQQLRTFLLVLFGEVLFSHASSKLSVVFLPLLADLVEWGSMLGMGPAWHTYTPHSSTLRMVVLAS